jgi:hypothetical protein
MAHNNKRDSNSDMKFDYSLSLRAQFAKELVVYQFYREVFPYQIVKNMKRESGVVNPPMLRLWRARS